jgi:hypothetical protein
MGPIGQLNEMLFVFNLLLSGRKTSEDCWEDELDEFTIWLIGWIQAEDYSEPQ